MEEDVLVLTPEILATEAKSPLIGNSPHPPLSHLNSRWTWRPTQSKTFCFTQVAMPLKQGPYMRLTTTGIVVQRKPYIVIDVHYRRLGS